MSRKKKREPKPRRAEPVTYWHGGTPGLAPGTLLLPASVLGWDQTHAELGWVGPNDYYDRTKVYLATVRKVARASAGTWHATGSVGGGALYRVKPIGAVERDPDIPGSYMAAQARILAVEEADVQMSPLELNQGDADGTFYVDGWPVYSADGWQLAEPGTVTRAEVREQLVTANLMIATQERAWHRARNQPCDVAAPTLPELLAAIRAVELWRPGPPVREGFVSPDQGESRPDPVEWLAGR